MKSYFKFISFLMTIISISSYLLADTFMHPNSNAQIKTDDKQNTYLLYFNSDDTSYVFNRYDSLMHFEESFHYMPAISNTIFQSFKTYYNKGVLDAIVGYYAIAWLGPDPNYTPSNMTPYTNTQYIRVFDENFALVKNKNLGIGVGDIINCSFTDKNSIIVLYINRDSYTGYIYPTVYGKLFNYISGASKTVNIHSNYWSQAWDGLNVKNFTQGDGFLISWNDSYIVNYFSNKYTLYLEKFSSEGNFQDSLTISSEKGFLHFDTDIDTSNNILTSWIYKNDPTFTIYGKWFDKNLIPISDTLKFEVAPYNIDFTQYMCDINENNNYIIAWESRVGSYHRIHAQHFNSNNEKIGCVFRLPSLNRSENERLKSIHLSKDKIYSFWFINDSNWKNNGIWNNIRYFNDTETSIESIPYLNFMLDQNYPNPFNPRTSIIYHLYANSDIKLSIYDITGRHITTLIDNYQSAGQYSVNWDASNIAAGIYIYTLQASGRTESKKMLLLK